MKRQTKYPKGKTSRILMAMFLPVIFVVWMIGELARAYSPKPIPSEPPPL